MTTDPSGEGLTAEVACRAAHPVRWDVNRANLPCHACERGAAAVHAHYAAALLSPGVVEAGSRALPPDMTPWWRESRARGVLSAAVAALPQPTATARVCGGCNVREPWEHRCHGAAVCDCAECRELEGMTPEEVQAALERAQPTTTGGES